MDRQPSAYGGNSGNSFGRIMSVLKILVPLLVVVAAVFSAFLRFKEENQSAIQTRNREYIQDFTLSVAGTLDRKFSDAEIAVETIANSVDYDTLCRPGDAEELLRILENETQFDHVRFVDAGGVSHTSSGISRDVSFRSYYTEGMKGNAGTTYLTDSVLTNQRQIGFYAPIIRDGAVRGEIVVFYDESTLAEGLSYDFYGQKSSVAIIDSKGEMLVNSPSPGLLRLYNQGLPENLLEQAETGMLDDATGTRVRTALQNHTAAGLTLRMNGSETVGYLAPLASEGLSVYMIFPYQANADLFNSSIAAGRKLQVSLITAFGCFGAYLLILGTYRLQSEKNSNGLAVLIAKADKAVSKGQLIVYPDDDRFENHSLIQMRDPGQGNMDRLEAELLRYAEDTQDRQETTAFLQQVRSSVPPEDYPAVDIRWKDQQDRTVYYNLTYIPVTEKAGTVTTGVIQVRDVTAQRKEEHEAKTALQNALKDAETANQAKSTFLFNMSHDIRTPMNAIIGYANLMENTLDDPGKTGRYLQNIKSSSDFLLSLINNVLEMARIESGKSTLDEEVIGTWVVGDEVRSVYAELMKNKNIRFTQITEMKTPYVFGDKVKLCEIFLNLVSNAYKYTPNGGSVSISIIELPGEKEGWINVRTTVSDTGIGMSEDYLPHIFEEFSRERNATDAKIAGTGLGMPIVKKLVDLMGGTITVESESGKGTTFVVTIPHRIAPDPAASPEDREQTAPDTFEGKRILLAEDNELNAEIAIEILTEYGFDVEHAEDGIICVDMLNKAEAGYYDLILMDIQMPNMNGYDAAKTIRKLQDPVRANIPILAITANAFEEDKRNALEAGMNGHLAKPIDVPELIRALTGILG